MKGILVFKLPEEREEFEMTQKAGSYYSALFDIDNYLRAKCKHEGEKWACEFREKFHEILKENDVEL